jgi:hypothetical protein
MERRAASRGVVVMPREGAIIFRDLVGKLDPPTQAGQQHERPVRGDQA